MIGWQNKNDVVVGNIGERIVRDILNSKGYVLYAPLNHELAHAFDMLAEKDKKDLFIVEVKTKRSREEYPDTGVDTRNYWVYKELSEKHNLPIFVYFVDYHLGEIYGNYLDILEENITIYFENRELDYPRFEGGIIYFPLQSMVHIDYLTNKEIDEILKLKR